VDRGFRTEILAAIDIAKASVDRGEGTEITRESMRALAEDVKRRGRTQLAAEHHPTGVMWCIAWHRRRGLNSQQHLELYRQRRRQCRRR
jgi:hypothetical protein